MDFARFLDLSPFLDFYLILNFHFWTKMEYYPSVPKNIPNFCRLLLLLILPLITDYQSAIMPIILKKWIVLQMRFFLNIKDPQIVLLFYILKSKTLKERKISWINHMNLFSVYTLSWKPYFHPKIQFRQNLIFLTY